MSANVVVGDFVTFSISVMIVSDVVCCLYVIHSFHKFRQYLVSSNVFLGMPLLLASSTCMSVSVFAGAKQHHREELVVGREGGGGSTGMVWAVVLNEGSGDSACDRIICCSLIVVSKRSSASASIALEISSIVCS